jgi:hypothetical protein
MQQLQLFFASPRHHRWPRGQGRVSFRLASHQMYGARTIRYETSEHSQRSRGGCA